MSTNRWLVPWIALATAGVAIVAAVVVARRGGRGRVTTSQAGRDVNPSAAAGRAVPPQQAVEAPSPAEPSPSPSVGAGADASASEARTSSPVDQRVPAD